MRKRSFYKRLTLLPAILWYSLMPVTGQQANTLFLLHGIPQTNFLNPAVQLSCKWFVGFPGLASAHLAYNNSAWTYNDLAGSDTWNLERAYDQMHRVDMIETEMQLHSIALGHRYRSLYFTFHVADRFHAFQTIPRELAAVALYGNAEFIGKTASFNSLRTAHYHLREYSFGLSRVLDERWTVGIRGRLLFGKTSAYTSRSRLGLTTDENTFDLFLNGDYTINGSFPATITTDAGGDITNIELGDPDPVQLLLNRGNPGFAMDVGVIYRYSEQLTLSASMLDLGALRWKTDLNNVHFSGSFDFTGVDPSTDIISYQFVNDIRDSILNAFETEVTSRPYTTFLPAQIFLGGRYRLKENLSVGAVSRNVIVRHKLHSSLTLSATTDVSGLFLASVSWSYLNNSPWNLGAALAYHGRGFQFHVVSDNLFGFFYPFNTRSLNLRAGFNIMFGCPRDKKEELEQESYGKLPRGGDCSWTDWKKNREKRMKRAARELTDI